jgi:hydroxylamine reductase (hybrid-cluster protein)
MRTETYAQDGMSMASAITEGFSCDIEDLPLLLVREYLKRGALKIQLYAQSSCLLIGGAQRIQLSR